ncbi:T9SS type A sorting domain-containing protein [bacterium]|nr:T9SS type A sorting domain-containing protein [bacterium]
MLKRLVLFCLLLVSTIGFSEAGIVSGNIEFGGSGAGFVIILESSLLDADTVNPEDIPFASFFTAGPYEIEHTFSDLLGYFAVAGMPAGGFVPFPGDPAGQYPDNPFHTSGGNASGINIPLDTICTISGIITWSGNYDDVFINVYDAYPMILALVGMGDGGLELEETIDIDGPDFEILVTSGPKKLVAFLDENANETLDLYEIRDTARSTLSDIFFAGGGAAFDDVTMDLDVSGVREIDLLPTTNAICAYPNPFNAATTIAYTVDRPGQVMITIYDLRGCQIDILRDNFHNAGSFSVRWEGRDSAGRSLAHGIYLCKMSTSNQEKVSRLLYLK